MPSEPEKYSIDEMMDRLKTGPEKGPEDGELVTRADGSQAIRVRKRKRRSSQPHKEEAKRSRRSRIVQVSLALVLVFLALLTVGGAVVFANSKPFRNKLADHIATATGAKTELVQFRMNPKTANAGSLGLEWPAGNVMKSLTLLDLAADIFPSSFLGKQMKGEEILMRSAVLKLRVPQAGEALRAFPAAAGEIPVAFHRYRTAQFELLLGDKPPHAIHLQQSEVSLSSTSVSGRPQMRLYQGALDVAGWPRMLLDRGLVEFTGSDVDILGLRVVQEKDAQGFMEFSGTVAPYKPEQASTLEVRLDSFGIAGVAGPELGRFFQGRIDTIGAAEANHYTFRPSDAPAAVFEISFRASPAEAPALGSLPFLHILADVMHDEWFDHPVFQTGATGTIRRENGAISIRNLDFATKGRMAIRGELSVSATGALGGKLRVGVTEAMIATSGNRRLDSVFGSPEDGFRWVDVTAAGSSQAPADDFKETFNSATLKEAPAEEAASPAPSFEELTRPR